MTQVSKAPWKYFGTPIAVTGVIGVVEDYPPNSDFSKILNTRESAEIVIATENDVIVDMFLKTSSGNLVEGDQVTLYGYVVGKMEVPNQAGGFFTHLIFVGNTYD
jgi:hypothetical protein